MGACDEGACDEAAEMSLRAKQVSYRIDDTDLVSGIDLTVGEGQLVAVLGPNGAGKSTLLQLLAGDLKPTRGSVQLDGVDIGQISTQDLALQRAFLSQNPRLDLDFTVQAIVEMGRYPHRAQTDNSPAIDREAVADALTRVEITHLADRVVGSLSGGERQRVSLARIIAQRTPLLLMDEPTTFTDVAHQELIMIEARRIAAERGSVVAIIHDLNLAAAYADRILLLSKGQTVACGQPAEVLTSETLTDTYQLSMQVVEHPFRDGPLVLTVPQEITTETR